MAYEKRRKIGLPAHHHQDDADWIESQLIQISDANQLTAKTGYSEKYQAAYNSCDIEYKRTNLARRTANILLRNFVNKCKKAREEYKPSEPMRNNSEYVF